MKSAKTKLHEKRFERKLIRKFRRTKNKQLRAALWNVRTELATIDEEEWNQNHWRLYLTEQVISRELKRRELLEWALKTGAPTKEVEKKQGSLSHPLSQ